MADVPEATPDQLIITLAWTPTKDGGLSGTLTARNVSADRVRLTGKPGLQPLGTDGRPLDARTIVTAEFRWPGYAELAPGESASASVGWGGWDGSEPSGEVLIRWPGGQASVTADGPGRPPSTGPSTNLFSSWFVT